MRSKNPSRNTFVAAAIFWLISAALVAGRTTASDSLEIFNRRILPILSAKSPSSCTECHLSGVELKDYLNASQEKTFAGLLRAGLIDVKHPDDSKILTFIARKPERPSLIGDKARQQEHDAFRSWIRAAVADPALLAGKGDAKPAGPLVPDEVVRHARRDRVLASFVDNIWSESGRCIGCHSPDRNQEQVKKHGEQVSWITPDDPAATLNHLVEAELIDLAAPEKSLLLLKPSNQVKHGGGQKMLVGDRSYKQFRQFLEDFAAVKAGKYKSAAELPKVGSEVFWTSGAWLKLIDVPAKFDKLPLRADVYLADADEPTGWSKTRLATGERAVGGQIWQQHVTLCAPRGSERAAKLRQEPGLPKGKYLAKIYIDQQGRLEKNYPYEMGAEEYVGQVEFESSWPTGYGNMTQVKFPQP